MANKTIQVNELFGPTIQGEGPLLGYPCFFIRLHNCPVQCPGCDTHYTWDGTEKGKPLSLAQFSANPPPGEYLGAWLDSITQSSRWKHCGIVLSGGEPLLHYKNQPFIDLLTKWKLDGVDLAVPGMNKRWLALETSGFVGETAIANRSGFPGRQLANFLCLFESISLSPKVTPCLHGDGWTKDELLNNVQFITDVADEHGLSGLFIKMVVRDEADVAEVKRCDEKFGWQDRGLTIHVMPYGQERDEILKTCELLVPTCAENGWVLTPRLHSLIWGKERMR